MSVKGDRSRVYNFTRYEKNYTKIFGDWVETKTTAPKPKKEKTLNKSKTPKLI
tara:strand:- start:52 stop:210 length:159 start_codon:yes stop_codon:yes gene_type:complete